MKKNQLSNMYFKLFANCKLVAGRRRSAIYDLQRELLYHIPNTLANIIKTFEGKKIGEVYKKFGDQSTVVNEYFNFLIEKDLIVLMHNIENFENFIEVDSGFYYPKSLSCAVIGIASSTANGNYLELLCKNLYETKCPYVQLRFHPEMMVDEIEAVLSVFVEKSIFRGISIALNIDIYDKIIKSKILNHPVVYMVIWYGASEKRLEHIEENQKSDKAVFYLNNDFPEFKEFNKLRFKYFQPNLMSFTEALNYNLYYNQKAYIDITGNIFQSPFTTNKVMGNIRVHRLNEVVKKKEFQELWEIGKDKIAICRECEFRYVCCDGRIPIKVEGSDHYKYEDDCSYSPYQA